MASLCEQRSWCLPCWQCHQKPCWLSWLTHEGEVNVDLSTLWQWPRGTLEENTYNKQSPIAGVLDYATPKLDRSASSRRQVSKYSISTKGQCSEPLKYLPKVTTELKTNPKVTGTEEEVSSLWPSTRETLNPSYLKAVSTPAASAPSGNVSDMHNVRPDLSYWFLDTFMGFLHTLMLKKHCSHSLF